jgi:hypothetical protein
MFEANRRLALVEAEEIENEICVRAVRFDGAHRLSTRTTDASQLAPSPVKWMQRSKQHRVSVSIRKVIFWRAWMGFSFRANLGSPRFASTWIS